jgi:hypothetical protein
MQWPKLPIRHELIDPNYRNVRFGSKADICAATSHVRYDQGQEIRSRQQIDGTF